MIGALKWHQLPRQIEISNFCFSILSLVLSGELCSLSGQYFISNSSKILATTHNLVQGESHLLLFSRNILNIAVPGDTQIVFFID
jgi:hypothetical protein